VVWTWNKQTQICSLKHSEAVKLTKEGFVSGRKSAAKYIGCYVDNEIRDLPVMQESEEMTPELCADICRVYKYFGLQYSKQCFCGDTYGKYGAAPSETECSASCIGASDATCGGNWRNSVYQLLPQEDLSTWVEFINTDFSDQNVAGWTATGLKSDQQLTVARCGTRSILGGVNILGKGNTLQWHYNSPIVFSKIKIYFTFAFLASWDTEDAWMTVNNVEVWRRKSQWGSHVRPGPCSGNKYGDEFEEFEVSADLQSVGDLVITFYNNLDTANTSDESFGLTYFRILVKPDPFQYRNIALNKDVSQSSTKDGNSAGRAIDGNTDGDPAHGSVAITNTEVNPWFEIDLKGTFFVHQVILFNRKDCCQDQIVPFVIKLNDEWGNVIASTNYNAQVQDNYIANFDVDGVRKVRVQVEATEARSLSIAELQILGEGYVVETIKIKTVAGDEGKTIIYLLGSDLKDAPNSVFVTITSLPFSGKLSENVYDLWLDINFVPYYVSHDKFRVTYTPDFYPITTDFTFEVYNSDYTLIRFSTVSIEVTLNSPYLCDVPGADSTAEIEVGEIHSLNGIDDKSQRIKFQRKYRNPVVIAEPLSYNGKDQAILRITNVDSDGFDCHVQESVEKDGTHFKKENTGYLVLESGSWILADGTPIEVGKTVTYATVGNNQEETWKAVEFSHPAFSTVPVIFTQVQTNNDLHWVKTRQAHSTTKGFEVSLEEEDANEITHGGEIVGWIAIEKKQGGWSGKAYEVSDTGDKVTDAWFPLKFQKPFNSVPILIAAMQTYDNTGSTHLRYDNLANDGVSLSWFRDTGSSSSSANTENVGYIVFETDGELKAANAYCSSMPLAKDMDINTRQGNVEVIQLLSPEYASKVQVVLVTLPNKGALY
jgi:hypothetical protein